MEKYSRQELAKLPYKYKSEALVGETDKENALVRIQCPECKKFFKKGSTCCFKCNEYLIKGRDNTSKKHQESRYEPSLKKTNTSLAFSGALVSALGLVAVPAVLQFLLLDRFPLEKILAAIDGHLLVTIPVVLSILAFAILILINIRNKD